MSRVGQLPIEVPSGVDVTIEGREVTVKGKLGELSLTLVKDVEVAREDDKLIVSPRNDPKRARPPSGTPRRPPHNTLPSPTARLPRHPPSHAVPSPLVPIRPLPYRPHSSLALSCQSVPCPIVPIRPLPYRPNPSLPYCPNPSPRHSPHGEPP